MARQVQFPTSQSTLTPHWFQRIIKPECRCTDLHVSARCLTLMTTAFLNWLPLKISPLAQGLFTGLIIAINLPSTSLPLRKSETVETCRIFLCTKEKLL